MMASGIDAMWKTIREKEPVRPSTKPGQSSGLVLVLALLDKGLQQA